MLIRAKTKTQLLRIALVFAMVIPVLTGLTAQSDPDRQEKEQFIEGEREKLARSGFRKAKMLNRVEDPQECIALLKEDGKFADLLFLHKQWDSLNQAGVDEQQIVGDYIEKALVRLWSIAELFRNGNMPGKDPEALRRRVFKSYTLYQELEQRRPDIGRFHQSCFAMPRSGINTYFCFYDIMEEIESGDLKDSLLEAGREAMMDIGFQAWTQPRRLDRTDENVISVDRFQDHVWWVGGNALGYRALFESAAMMSSVEMMDVIAEVSKKSISVVSQTTYGESFWTEGLTADGAGWGHGMQCLVWGYPIHGTSAALNNLNRFQGSPWVQKLSRENIDCLFRFFRASAFLYHKGIEPPALSRQSANWEGATPRAIPSNLLVENLLDNWTSSFTPEQLAELRQFKREAEQHKLIMENYPDGDYHGTRYFFNNDNFAKKTSAYYSLISMASLRCDGIESFHKKADAYNLYTCDGMTFFQRAGNEYKLAMGAWNLTAPPGVTARQLDVLQPFTNWRGYTSKRNFAAGATRGGENGVAGFIFEKMNASAKKNVNDRTGLDEKNPDILGIKAFKSYFWFGDMFLAMGAGISDLSDSSDRPIWTVLDQTLGKDEILENTGLQEIHGEKITWVENNGFSYAVLPEYTDGGIFFNIEKRQTFYDSLNVENRALGEKPEKVVVFQMWIDHGNEPENANYAYLVNCNPDKLEEIPRVLQNDTLIQAACSSDGKTLEAMFYAPGQKLRFGNYWFEVSAPCAFMLEEKNKQLYFTVCDAKMDENLRQILIRTNLPVKGDHITRQKDYRLLSIPLPGEPYRGKPATVLVKNRKRLLPSDGNRAMQ